MYTYLCVSELNAISPLLIIHSSSAVLVLSFPVSLSTHPVTRILAVVWPVVDAFALVAVLVPGPIVDFPCSPSLDSDSMLFVIVVLALIFGTRSPGEHTLATLLALMPLSYILVA